MAGCGGGGPTSAKPVAWGLTVGPGLTVGDVQARSTAVLGQKVRYLERFFSLDLSDAGLTSALEELREQSVRGTTIVVTLEPGNQLAEVAEGRLDQRLTAIAATLAAFRGTVAVRFGHEMNGDWYPWSGDPSTYVRAWRHVHDLLDTHAPTVRMVWAVNASDAPADNRFEHYWPGRRYVDVVGVDGYNCLAGWRSPAAVFDTALHRLDELVGDAPIWITETASCEADSLRDAPRGASKATWIEQLFTLARARGIAVVIWFDRDKEFDWQIDTSPASSTALRRGLTQEKTRT